MALLAFESSPSAPQSILELLSPAQRLKTAGEVNAAILESLSQGKDAKLVGLLKLLCWGETMLEEKAEFPKVRVRDAAIDALLTPAYCSLISERGCLRSYFHNFFFSFIQVFRLSPLLYNNGLLYLEPVWRMYTIDWLSHDTAVA